jgi:hypothetical protein
MPVSARIPATAAPARAAFRNVLRCIVEQSISLLSNRRLVVADKSPIFYLLGIGRIELLPHLFQKNFDSRCGV